MARTSTETRKRSIGRQRRQQARSARREVRIELGEARSDLGRARGKFRRAAADVGEAGRDVMQAGQAGVAAAREVVGAAGERAGKVASVAGRRVGEAAEAAREAAEAARERAMDLAVEARRTARGIGTRILTLPRLVRERARRTREAIETAGARAAVSMIQTGTKVLRAAANYVSPRRRVQPKALEQLVVEQLRWVHMGTEAYDRTIPESEETDMRRQLVRYKLETIKQAETLSELLRELGGRLPPEERQAPLPRFPGRDAAQARGPAAVRQGLAHALTVALQSAEGWRGLNRIALWAEQDRLCDAILRASDAVGSEPEEQVEFLRQALLGQTIEMVLG